MSAREPLSDDERALQRALDLAPPAPRKSDAAFARAVAERVGDGRRPAYWLPATLATAVCAALLFFAPGATPDDEVAAPVVTPPADLLHATLAALDDEDELAGDEGLVAVADEGYDALWEPTADTDDDDLDLAGDTSLPDDDESLVALATLLDEALLAQAR